MKKSSNRLSLKFPFLVLLNFLAPVISHAAEPRVVLSGEVEKMSVINPTKQLVGEEKAKAQAEISNASKQIKTLRSDFVQTKSVALMDGEQKSEGKMYFSEGRLRWEYTSPYKSVFVVNGQKVLTQSERGVTSTNLSSGRGFSGIANIIIKCVTGDLDDSSQFKADYYKDGKGQYTVVLTPLKREAKRVFSSFTINFDKALRVKTVEMTESGGGTTLITIVSPVINAPIDKSLFEIN